MKNRRDSARFRSVILLGIVGLSVISSILPQETAFAAEAVIYLKGWSSDPSGAVDCNPCLSDPINAVYTLRDRGETMGFSWGDNYPEVQGAGTSNHWQGIQRLPSHLLGSHTSPIIVLSSSHRYDLLPPDEPDYLPAHFAVVQLSSRDLYPGRLRSNRMAFAQRSKDVPPPVSDRIVRAQPISDLYYHPGGMQNIGKYLLVGTDGNITSALYTSMFFLFDMSDPLNPDSIWEMCLPPCAEGDANANSVGVTRLQDGTYLIVRARSDATKLDFYKSEFPDVVHPGSWQFLDTWDQSELQSEICENGTCDTKWANISLCGAGYQNTNLVVKCGSGEIYLLATHGRCPNWIGGDDFVDLYRLDIPSAGGDAIVTKVAKRHMFPSDNAGDRQADLQAAAGAYVSPDNKLYLYASEHGVSGPNGTVEMIEFGPELPATYVDLLEDSWVVLYQDADYSGRYIYLDFKDASKVDYAFFSNIEDFNDNASSLIFLFPEGYRVRLYNNSSQDASAGILDLNGTGSVEMIPDLSVIPLDLNNTENAGDKFSSGAWNAGLSGEEWVDFHVSWGLGCSITCGLLGWSGNCGSEACPHKTLESAVAEILPFGTIKIKSDSTSELIRIEKPMRLEAVGGIVRIGQQ